MNKIPVTLSKLPVFQYAHECHPLSYMHPPTEHRCDVLALTYFAEGEWEWKLNGETCRLGPNSCLLTHPGLVTQGARLCGGSRHSFYAIEVRPFSDHQSGPPADPCYSFLLPELVTCIPADNLKALLKQVIHYHTLGEDLSALGFFLQALSLYEALGKHQGVYNYGRLYCNQIIRYLGQNYDRPLRLEEIAALVGLSTPYCCKVFHQEMGVSIMQYLNQLRVNHAKDYIQSGKNSLKEIAALVGVPNYSYFCRIFKQYEFMSPSRFLRLNSRNEENGFIFAQYKDTSKAVYPDGRVYHVKRNENKIEI